MISINRRSRILVYPLIPVVLLIISLNACTPGSPQVLRDSQPTTDLTEVFQSALLTATYAVEGEPLEKPDTLPPAATATENPTQTNIPPTPEGTPIPLPQFQTSQLHSDAQPQAYIDDNCQFLSARWNPENSEPGTVVVPVMFHYIWDDEKEITDNYTVHKSAFYSYMQTAHAYDFEAITMSQLVDFLYNNGKIPRLSLINIVDDRHKKAYFREFFRPFYDEYDWPVVNSWISTPLSDEDLWQQQIEMSEEGWVDYQAHGVVHNVPIVDFEPNQMITTDVFGTLTADEYIYQELTTPITVFQERFNKKPIAYIWPGGGFGIKGVEVARQAGYQVGFTVYERGPIMFNWVPLGIQERSVNDPLLVLPRYWSFAIEYQLEEIMEISAEAAAHAQQNRQQELEWYGIYCPHYPQIPEINEAVQ